MVTVLLHLSGELNVQILHNSAQALGAFAEKQGAVEIHVLEEFVCVISLNPRV